MTTIIIILSAALFWAGIKTEMPEISLLALQIFSVFVVSCIIDAILGLISLKRTTAKGSTRGKTRHPLTWVGRQFSTYQEAISYRLNSLSDQVAQNSGQVEVQTPEPTVDTQESFLEEILNELENAFKPTTCALLFADQGNCIPNISIKGTKGKRVEESLKKIFAGWFISGSTEWLGLHDTLHHNFPNDELSTFGIRYIVSSKIENSDKKGILLLGFGSDNAHLFSVLNQLDVYSKKLERELETFESFQQLKSRVDQAEKASQARSEFLTHVSHDIKSPLNNIKAILSLLRDDLSSSSEGPALLDTALRNCDSVAELVDSLIDFAKHRSGKLVANKSEFNLGEVVADIVRTFEPSAKTKGLDLTFLSPTSECKCLADKTHIRRIVTNLISNAIKYSNTGTINVVINTLDEQNLFVRIKDNGPGFSDQQLKQIFTPFTRFDTQGIEGAGLGLAVCKILSELNGGILSVSSKFGSGSEFTVTVPSAQTGQLRFSNDNQDNIVDFTTMNQHEAEKPRINRLQGLKLLVVDDEVEATQSLSRILAKEGADTAQANTVPDAMSIMNFDCPDVLITDANMPGGGGVKLIKFIKVNFPDTAVIVVSGDISNSDELIALGATCVMDKPVHISELLDYLEDIFENTQKQQAVGT